MSSGSKKACYCSVCNGRKVSTYIRRQHMDSMHRRSQSSLDDSTDSFSLDGNLPSSSLGSSSSSGGKIPRKRSITCLEEPMTRDIQNSNAESKPEMESESDMTSKV